MRTKQKRIVHLKRKLLSLIMAAAMALALLPATALAAGSNVSNDDYAFDADTGTLTVKTYDGGTAWRGSYESFTSDDVMAVDIQYGVTRIKMGAFSGCSALTSVTLPASVTAVEAWAFYNCTSLSAVDLSGVTEIGTRAFEGCTGLTTVNLSSATGNVEYDTTGIDDRAFYGCTNLTSVTFPAGAYTIGDNAFNSTGLSGSIDLSGVTEIGECAFNGCADLTSVTFPAGAYIIGDYAFCGTGLSGRIDLGGVTAIGECAFEGRGDLTSVTFPDTAYTIGDCAFKFTGLSGSIDLGGVTEIGEEAFFNCADLTILLTSADVPTFDEWWAYQVPRVYYPAAWGAPGSVQYLNHGGNARPNPVETADYSFNVLTGTLTIKTNAGTAYSDDGYANTNWQHLSSGIDPDAVTSVIFEDGVTAIGGRAFWGCAGLTSVTFPDGPYTIGDFAFVETSLTAIDLCGVTAIGWLAFGDCTSLTSIVFPSSAYTIGVEAFFGDTALTMVDLRGVTKIGESAFYELNNLTIILSSETPPIFANAWAVGVHRVCYPAAWGAPDSVTNLNYNSNAFAIIDTAAITSLTAPVRGAAPVSAITETAQYTGTVTWSPSESTFAANTVYTATVTLTPKTYYTLDCVPENFFTVAGATVTNEANSGVITAVFPATEAEPDTAINIAAISGVTAPVRGGTPVTSITETAQYTGTVTWAPINNPFAASTSYTATITLTPKAGYTLNGVAANFFTVAGAITVSNTANTGVITAVFPATEAEPDTVVDIAAIAGVTAPARDAVPVTAITETAQYTGTITWSPAHSPFGASTVYTATITLTPKAGYTLNGVTEDFFTVAGATATNAANTGVITAVFPATEAEPDTVVDIAAIAGVTAPARGAVPVTAITETAQYTGTITWNPADSPFAASTAYTATITLTPKAGYTLTGVGANLFTVAGATATNPAGSGVVTAVFPATAVLTGATISPITTIFDLDNPSDIVTFITLNDATTVTGVVYGSDVLESPDDFTIDGNALTITEEFLSGLNLSDGDTVVLALSFDVGNATLTIEVEQSYIPGTDASLSDLTVGGSSVSSFAADTYSYNVQLPYGTQPGNAAAIVNATASDSKAAVNITQAATLPGSATVEVTAEDGTEQTYTINFTLEAAPNTAPIRKAAVPATATASMTVNTAYTLNLAKIFEDANADTLTYKVSVNGSADTGANASYSYTPASTGTTTLVFKANDGTVDSTDTYTVTLTANAAPNGGGDGGGGSSKSTTPPAETPQTETTITGNTATATTTTIATVDNNGKATAAVTSEQISDAISQALAEAQKQGNDTAAVVEIMVEAPADTKTVETSIPREAIELAVDGNTAALTVSTPIASISFDADALSAISGEAAEDVKITVSKVEASTLSAEAQQAVGDRPVFNFSVTSGDKTISEFGGSASVAIPYTPKDGEDTESIVIYYINAEGDLEIVSNCIYDPATGTVSFRTNHFSLYAIGYNKVSFNDVSANVWYSKAVGFIAARGITTGTGNRNYSPDAKLTRGEFLVMMMRAYGMAPDTDLANNFADAGNTYYTGYLAAAKKLGISGGVGNNMFAPGNEITRQEMFTLLYNALKVIGELPEGNTEKTLSEFSDSEQIASWAKDAMKLMAETGTISGSGGKLSSASITTRAEMAQVLYNLLSK